MVELLKLIHCVDSMFDLNIYSYTVSIYFSSFENNSVFIGDFPTECWLIVTDRSRTLVRDSESLY